MLPWNYGFHWSTGTVTFLGAFYTVLTAVVTTLVCALRRSRRVFTARRIAEVRWQSDFHNLPQADRACRHALTGELPGRECQNALDCRRCETHARLLALAPAPGAGEPEEDLFGFSFPPDRLYHRGHTWVHREADGTLTVGLDDFATCLLGAPDAVKLPSAGSRLRVNGPAWRLQKGMAKIRILSPVDGKVVERGGPGCPWYLRIQPADHAGDLRHLLGASEVRPWLLREIDHLQLALSAAGAPTLADGGVPVSDISAHYPDADWDAIYGAIFLEP